MRKVIIAGAPKALKIFLFGVVSLAVLFVAAVNLLCYSGPADAIKAEIKKVEKADPDKAFELYGQAIAAIKKDKKAPTWDLGNTYYDYALFLKEHARPLAAIDAFNQSLDLARKDAPPATISNLLFQIAEVRLDMEGKQPIKQYDLDQFLSIEKLRPRNDKKEERSFWSAYDLDLGKMYRALGQNEKALKAFERSAATADDIEYLRAEAQEGIIDLLVRSGKYDQANRKYIEYIPKLSEYAYILRSGFRKSLRRRSKNDDAFNGMEVQLLEAKRFSDLDAIAEKLAKERVVFSNGRWAINDFYESLISLDDAAFDSVWRKRIDLLEQWIKVKPESAPAKIALGRLLSSYAWKARGNGWADSVTDQGWKLFGERLERSRAVLEQVKVKPPEWYNSMQRVALGQGWEPSRYDAMVAECRKKYPDYDFVVFVKGWWLQPRWHGSEGDCEKYWLAEAQAADAVRKDNAGSILYARCVWYLDDNLIDNFLNESKVEWPRIKSGLQSLSKKYPDVPLVRGMLSTLAMEKNDKKSAEEAFGAEH